MVIHDNNRTSNQFVIDAVGCGDWITIKNFLNTKQDVDEALHTGWTLLLYASLFSQAEIIQQLLQRGADPNKHYEGHTPLMALSSSDREVSEKRMECLRHLLEAKANVNAFNKHKETALMFACKTQKTNFVVELLEHGAYIDFSDGLEWTALFYAVSSNNLENVQILIDKGADKDKKNFEGQKPYDVAIIKGFDQLLPLLSVDELSKIDNVEVQNINQWTDLFPKLMKLEDKNLSGDIEYILYGMGLGSCKKNFCGMDLRTFLKLKEEDLQKLGINLKLQREKFFYNLIKFHKHKWSNKLIKDSFLENLSPFEILKILGHINQQLVILSSSMYFSKNLDKQFDESEKSILDDTDKEQMLNDIKNMISLTTDLKNKTLELKKVFKGINEKNSDLSLPIFIKNTDNDNNEKKKNCNKIIVITVLSLTSICIWKIGRQSILLGLDRLCSKNLLSNTLSNAFSLKFNFINSFLP